MWFTGLTGWLAGWLAADAGVMMLTMDNSIVDVQ